MVSLRPHSGVILNFNPVTQVILALGWRCYEGVAVDILVINTGGSTSKFALYREGEVYCYREVEIAPEVRQLPVQAQLEPRYRQLREFLSTERIAVDRLAAIACRGGILAPLPRWGVYYVDQHMLDDLASGRYGEHPSNLSAQLGHRLTVDEGRDLPLFVVDPITIDEFPSRSRLSGVPEVERRSRFHALNLHYVCRLAAASLGRSLDQCDLVAVHLGTGISVIAVEQGRVIDVNDALLGEGPFTVERAGTLPLRGVLELAELYPLRVLREKFAKQSGFRAYLGTSDFRQVEERIKRGDEYARLVFDAFMDRLVKEIGAMVGLLDGRQQAVVVTGSMLRSELLSRELPARLDWVGKVILYPGNFEMEALGEGVERVLRGVDEAYPYPSEERKVSVITDFHELRRAAAEVESASPLILAGGADPRWRDLIRTLAHVDPGRLVVVDTPEKVARLNHDRLPPKVEVVSSEHPAKLAVQRALSERGVLVKLSISTDRLLHELLAAISGLYPPDRRPFLSHVAVLENRRSRKLLLITDGGLNVAPDLEQKIKILRNAVWVAHVLGIERPKVLLQAGMEDHGQDFPAIRDAREIRRRWQAGEIPDCIVDGPYGVDVALSADAARAKGIESPVAGQADIIVAANLEAANMAVKSVLLFTGAHWAGVIVGGPIPVVLGSRGDDPESRLLSVALGRVLSRALEVQATA